MDAVKTGQMIRQARTARGMTQKQLADALHLSDRTVSKWERGAGFPDVSLLEPLADTLGLTVQSLLRGEADTEAAARSRDDTLRAALRLLTEQSRRAVRHNVSRILASAVLLAFLGYLLYGVLELSGAFLKPVQLEVPAVLYRDGAVAGETIVTIDGTLRTAGTPSFEGRFVIPQAQATMQNDVTAFIEWDSPQQGCQTIRFARPGTLGVDAGIQQHLYISPDMTHFAVTLADGSIAAIHEGFAALQGLEGYRYALDYTDTPLFGYLHHSG